MAYDRHAEPTRINAVPSKAVMDRKMKNAAKLGARAVPMLHPKNSTAASWLIYTHMCQSQSSFPQSSPFSSWLGHEAITITEI